MLGDKSITKYEAAWIVRRAALISPLKDSEVHHIFSTLDLPYHILGIVSSELALVPIDKALFDFESPASPTTRQELVDRWVLSSRPNDAGVMSTRSESFVMPNTESVFVPDPSNVLSVEAYENNQIHDEVNDSLRDHSESEYNTGLVGLNISQLPASVVQW